LLTLPNASVVRFDGKDQVAVQQPDGGFAWHVVVLGVTNDAMTEVKSGLKSGDIVALKPAAERSLNEDGSQGAWIRPGHLPSRKQCTDCKTFPSRASNLGAFLGRCK
jgi:hypothetical protein